MATKTRLKSLGDNGMVSIIVTMILIIVMTLVVLAMSRNAITEQRQALDRQLSDQAFYNAESGINDWANYLSRNAGSTNIPNQKSRCDNTEIPTPPSPLPTQQIGPDATNTYSCILYDKAPTSIIFSNLDPKDGKTMPITPDISLQGLVFSWTSTNVQTTTGGCNFTVGGLLPPSLPPFCNVGGLKVDLVDQSSINRTDLTNNSFISYLLPNDSPILAPPSTILLSAGRGTANQGLKGIAKCVNNVGCSITVDIGGLPANSTLLMHIKSLYLTNNITITGFRNDGTPVRFINSQILIDATGKANDVLRRVQVRVGAQNQYEPTDFSLRTVDAICKLIRVDKDSATATLDARCQ